MDDNFEVGKRAHEQATQPEDDCEDESDREVDDFADSTVETLQLCFVSFLAHVDG